MAHAQGPGSGWGPYRRGHSPVNEGLFTMAGEMEGVRLPVVPPPPVLGEK